MPHSHHKNHFINFPIHKSTNHQLEHQLIQTFISACLAGELTLTCWRIMAWIDQSLLLNYHDVSHRSFLTDFIISPYYTRDL